MSQYICPDGGSTFCPCTGGDASTPYDCWCRVAPPAVLPDPLPCLDCGSLCQRICVDCGSETGPWSADDDAYCEACHERNAAPPLTTSPGASTI